MRGSTGEGSEAARMTDSVLSLALDAETAEALDRLVAAEPPGPIGLTRTRSEVALDLLRAELRRRGLLAPLESLKGRNDD